MMKKYLMTGLAAVALSGFFSGCSQEIETGVETTPEFNVLQKYENAFVARFGQPAEDQDWGFGSAAGTRAVVANPYVTPSKKTYNAQMAFAWQGVEAAKASGSDETLFNDMNNYASWKNSGWEDQFFDVHGTIVSSSSTVSDETIAALTNVIVGTQEKPGLIPENVNNLSKAQSTGYSIITKGGPVTLTPIYHYSNSGDRLSYYYYPVGSKPSVEEIKRMPKYSLGNMSDPQHNGDTHIYRNTYSLVYVDASGNCSYDFPANYVINFVISNTWNDYNGYTDKIYQEGGITTTVAGSEPTLISQGKYAITAGETIENGTTKSTEGGKVQIKFGNGKNPPVFNPTTHVDNPLVTANGTRFEYLFSGNGQDGSLFGGCTCYYLQVRETGKMNLAVRLNGGKTIRVVDFGSWWTDWNTVWNSTTGTQIYSQTAASNYDGICSFDVEAGHLYAAYAEGSKLGYYGYEFIQNNNVVETTPCGATGSFSCGEKFEFQKTYAQLGNNKVLFKTTEAKGGVTGYTAYTEGSSIKGGLSSGGACTYYFKPTESGVLRVAVSLAKNKEFCVVDLGDNGWDQTNGTTIISEIKDPNNTFNGTYDFDVVKDRVYAVYAKDTKLGFYGCEFFTKTGGSESMTSTSQVVWKNIPMTPDYYSDGDLNAEVHNTNYGYGVGSAAKTSHTAVFKGTVGETEYTFIGFEDWIDFDFNDLVFAITGTTPEKPQPPITIPDDPPTNDDPGTFVCRIIAEDLTVGENSDFDFNDVVFDIFWDSSSSTTTIRLRAAGGELPLYVAGHEVHKEFGYTNSYPLINTGWDGTLEYEKRYTDFTISGTYNTRELANTIPVMVTKKGKNEELINILLTAEQGKVASKVCVGRDYEWCRERQDIDDKFHKADGTKLFQQYVIKNLGDDWYQLRGK